METSEKNFDPQAHMLKLKGKDYLPVAARVLWFRQEHPIESGWAITSALVEGGFEKGYATFRAQIIDPDGRCVATGYNSEDKQGFGDYVMKAETGAIGRALAVCGYGTMAALDEGEIVDAPVGKEPTPAYQPAYSPNERPSIKHWPKCTECGEQLSRGEVDACRQAGIDHYCVRHAPGRPQHAHNPLTCAECGVTLTRSQATVSERKYQRRLCPAHQKGALAEAD